MIRNVGFCTLLLSSADDLRSQGLMVGRGGGAVGPRPLPLLAREHSPHLPQPGPSTSTSSLLVMRLTLVLFTVSLCCLHRVTCELLHNFALRIYRYTTVFNLVLFLSRFISWDLIGCCKYSIRTRVRKCIPIHIRFSKFKSCPPCLSSFCVMVKV